MKNPMKNKVMLCVFALVALLSANGSAANKSPKKSAPASQSSISGVILDQDSNEKLAGVTIQLSATGQKIYTDSKGEFSLDGIQPGTYKVKLNCISYKDKEVTVKVSKSKNETVKILLNPVTP
jgi:hypothetical protein